MRGKSSESNDKIKWIIEILVITTIVIGIVFVLNWMYPCQNIIEYSKLALELVVIFIALEGVSMLQDKLREKLYEKQFENHFGFYVHFVQQIEAFEQLFLGKGHKQKGFDDALMFCNLFTKTALSDNAINIAESQEEHFKQYSKQFYDFMLTSKEHVPPTNNIKGWYDSEVVLMKFLVFGMNCDKGSFNSYESLEDIKTYYDQVVNSMNTIREEINKGIDAMHSDYNR